MNDKETLIGRPFVDDVAPEYQAFLDAAFPDAPQIEREYRYMMWYRGWAMQSLNDGAYPSRERQLQAYRAEYASMDSQILENFLKLAFNTTIEQR